MCPLPKNALFPSPPDSHDAEEWVLFWNPGLIVNYPVISKVRDDKDQKRDQLDPVVKIPINATRISWFMSLVFGLVTCCHPVKPPESSKNCDQGSCCRCGFSWGTPESAATCDRIVSRRAKLCRKDVLHAVGISPHLLFHVLILWFVSPPSRWQMMTLWIPSM